MSDFALPPLPPLRLTGYKPTTRHRLLTPGLADDIRNLIGARLQLYSEWKLVYSLEQHGASLNTLYTRCLPDFERASNNIHLLNKAYTYLSSSTMEGHQKRLGYVLVVRDTKGNTFGAYSNEYFRPAERFYGNGECFLWTTNVGDVLRFHQKEPEEAKPEDGKEPKESRGRLRSFYEKLDSSFLTLSGRRATEPPKDLEKVEKAIEPESKEDNSKHLQFRAFSYTGLNDYIIHCSKTFFSMGVSDGHYGLWMDGSLTDGLSFGTMTFGNDPLSALGVKFKISNVEVWRIGE